MTLHARLVDGSGTRLADESAAGLRGLRLNVPAIVELGVTAWLVRPG
jgi:hypothetical protein